MVVNPYDHNYIYGGNYLTGYEGEDKAWTVRSKNGGKTWDVISGAMNVERANRIFIDQKDQKKIFIVTRFGIIEGRDSNAPGKSEE